MELNDFISERVVHILMLTAKVAFVYIVAVWVALVFWALRDIRQRTRDRLAQALSVLITLALFLPGYWLYLILRPRLTIAEREEERLRMKLLTDYSASCPECQATVREDFIICPSCQYALRRACAGCSHALQDAWRACPYCGSPAARPSAPLPGPAVILPEPAPVESSLVEQGVPA